MIHHQKFVTVYLSLGIFYSSQFFFNFFFFFFCRCNGCTLSGKRDHTLKLFAQLGDKKYGDFKFPPFLVDLKNSRILPHLDHDKDFFAPNERLSRGSTWRGRDCDDKNPNIKPVIKKKKN